jgi:hypothetical protein
MPTDPIPGWNARGVLPPIDSVSPTSVSRSPYAVSLLDVVTRFATSPERAQILKGFLNYRAALHAIGLTAGFQWLDGSFAEDIEMLERRNPRDIDVVTFIEVPATFQPPPQADVLDHDRAKQQFSVDAYFVELNLIPARELPKHATYWYGMWSHRRDQEWKGFLEINLDPAEDGAAAASLAQYDPGAGVQP